jgi:hypothetical protein
MIQILVWLLLGGVSAKVMSPYAITQTGKRILQVFCILTGPMFFLMWLVKHPDPDSPPDPLRCPHCGVSVTWSGDVYAWIHYETCPCACVNEEARRILYGE